MRGKIFLISLLISLLIPIACKSPVEPEEPYPDPNSAVFEIMYERVKEVVNASGSDPFGGASIYHPTNGGQNSSNWIVAGENRWRSEALLKYDRTPYRISLVDMKVVKEYKAIAEDIYMRKKGQEAWVKLTCIKKAIGITGEEAEFIVDSSGIRNPCGS